MPQSFRVVAISQGATGWQQSGVWFAPGAARIQTGVILVGGRLVNAPILFTGAAFFLPHCRSPQWMRTMACLTIVRHIDAVPGMPTASIWHRAGTAAFVLGDEYCRDGDSIARPGAPQCEENGKTL